ncbi:MAG: Mur ligase family protein [Candidatus Andersenbacteria bacterium]
MNKFLQRIEWARAEEYVSRHKIGLVGVVGSYHTQLITRTVGAALADAQSVRVASAVYDLQDVPECILGLRAQHGMLSWLRVLTNSKAKEITEAEPHTIVMNVPCRKPGDVDAFGYTFPPALAVIHNVDAVNLEQFVSKQNVAHEMMSLAVSVPANGSVVLHIDDPLVAAMQDHTSAHVTTYGESETADVRLLRATRVDKGFAVEIKVGQKIFEQHLPNVIGRHHISAILGGLAAAHAKRRNIQQALQALRNMPVPAGDLSMHTSSRGAQVLQETNNATPRSVELAIKTLNRYPASRRIVVLESIERLGSEAIAVHQALGERLVPTVDVLITVGTDARHAQEAVLRAGHADTHHFPKNADAAKWVGNMARPGDVILVAGSAGVQPIIDRL